MKIDVTIKGYIDVPNDWDDGQYLALDLVEFRYNDQLTIQDALNELARKMSKYPDSVEVRAEWPLGREGT